MAQQKPSQADHWTLQKQNPTVAAQWHPTKNGTLTPDDVTPFSGKKAWWMCKHGHEWQAIVKRRSLSGTRCPYCAGWKKWPGS